MANLNIRGLSDEQRQQLRVKAAQVDKSMESYARDRILASLQEQYYILQVERSGDREFVATKGNMTQLEAYECWDEWRQDEHVSRLWLKCDGEFDLVWPCAHHDLDERGRCRRCRTIGTASQE
jgi:plasmid stability protein